MSLWKGTSLQILRSIPNYIINFGYPAQLFRSTMISFLQKYGQNWWTNLITGIASNVYSVGLLYPIDYLYTRYLVDPSNLSVGEIAQETFGDEYLRGFFRGFLVTLLGSVIYRSLWISSNDFFVPIFGIKGNDGYWKSFFFNFTVSLIPAILTYPLDTIKRRLILQPGNYGKYKNSLEATTQIVEKDGFFSLFAGLTGDVLKQISSACGFIITDYFGI